MTDALTNQICSSKQKLDKNKNHLSFVFFSRLNVLIFYNESYYDYIKKCDKNMEEGSDHDIFVCEKWPVTFKTVEN